MSAQPTAYPDVVTREEWTGARTKLLAREREATHLRDAVNAERRRLPMVKIEKDYVFDGPDGAVRLLDMGLLHDQVTVSVTRPDWPVWS
ncbi:DUF899 family protein [Mycobacterium sp. SMC-16]|uniref:DUF899 family protein n=1 Tax=Mycobacterium sp. SMC-16 TaxID=3385967 RepID=UPI00390CA4A5